MIFTYKVTHNMDFSEELRKAKQIAQISVSRKNMATTNQHVKHIGLKTILSKQLLKKYCGNKNIRKVRNVNLVVPSTGIKIDKLHKTIFIPSLNFSFTYDFPNTFGKINQIEINNKNAYISVSILSKKNRIRNWIGVDLNTNGHVAVVANPVSGQICKMGKNIPHYNKKYNHIKRSLVRNRQSKKAACIEKKKNKIIYNLANNISKKIVTMAKQSRSAICLERIGSKKKRKNRIKKRERYSLYNWIFYHLAMQIEYKAKLLGVPVVHIDPYNTSKICSRCGHMGKRHQKSFECPYCGHIEHADVNAAFNIASRHESKTRSYADRGACEGSTGAPKEITILTQSTSKCAII